MLRKALVAIALLFALGALAPVASPVEASYVRSDSMAPTIEQGDAYLLVPAGDVEPGDVVTFRLDGTDQYVTHRVVAETPDGFRTRGDANPSADQAAGYPPVPRSAIVGEALAIGGQVGVVPYLGALLRLVQRHRAAAMLGAAVLLLSRVTGRRDRPAREAVTSRRAARVALLTTLVLGVALVGLTATRGAVRYPAAADAATRTHTVETTGLPLAYALVDVDGATVREPTPAGEGVVVAPGGRSDVSLTVAPTGPTTVTASTYPRTLPPRLLAWLYGMSPSLAAFGSVVAPLVPVAGVVRLLTDTTPVRPPRWRPLRRWGDG
ncbi:MAG: signal peptidase I [Halobacteriaceae archaeon]